jgi:hypothetical protein
MILCVIPNPAIDRTLHVDSLRVGEFHRAEKSLAVAGGKGLNVARTILALGEAQHQLCPNLDRRSILIRASAERIAAFYTFGGNLRQTKTRSLSPSKLSAERFNDHA